MAKNPDATEHPEPSGDSPTSGNPGTSVTTETFRRLNEVRAEALKHERLARQLAAERRDIIRGLIDDGFSQAEIARRMGVTRQAVQKMLAL